MTKLHPAQAEIERGLSRFNVLACGRRFGKDVYMMNKAVEAAIEGAPVGFGAPTYRMLLENWQTVDRLVAPALHRRSASERRLELVTGGVIDFYSLDKPDVIRGKKYRRFIVNEAGFVPGLMDTWNYIIRPTLADLRGDAIVGGTPKGRNGFWQLYTRGEDDQQDEWSSFRYSSYDNPHIPAGELDEMVAGMPEMVVQQEVYAAFLEDAGGVFRRVMDAATADEYDERIDKHQYVIGIDWGKSNDFTVLTVLDITDNNVPYIDRFNQIDYRVQLDRLRALIERFRPMLLLPERNSMGEPLIEQLMSDGYAVHPFTTTNASKAVAIDALALAFERGAIRIPKDPVLIGELQAYEMERLPSGMLRYSAPEGMHDDMVMSLALAWQGSRMSDSGIAAQPAQPSRFGGDEVGIDTTNKANQGGRWRKY